MDPEVRTQIINELGDSRLHRPNFHENFPLGDPGYPEISDLASYNIAACRTGKSTYDPQRPAAVAISCSQIDLDRVQSVQELGKVFLLSGRGGRVSTSGIASVEYGVDLDPSFMEVLVHTCTQKGICRTPEFQALDGSAEQLPILSYGDRPTFSGIMPIDIANNDLQIPRGDIEHAHSRFYRVASASPEIVELISSGKLLVGEAYFEEKTRRVHWLRFWRSSNPGNEVEVREGILRAIIDGRLNKEDYLRELHPGLRALNALVLGNNRFTQEYVLPVPTEVVVVGCADSRSSSIILQAPYGLVEWFKNAGNVIDDKMLLGLRVAVQSAKENLDSEFATNGTKYGDPEDYKRKPTLVVLSHTQCGAIKATVDQLAGRADHDATKVAPLVQPIARRLQDYINQHPDHHESDPHLAMAAQANAIGACIDIIASQNPNAQIIRDMLLRDELIIVPGRHSIKRGVVQLFKPLTAEHAQRMLPFI